MTADTGTSLTTVLSRLEMVPYTDAAGNVIKVAFMESKFFEWGWNLKGRSYMAEQLTVDLAWFMHEYEQRPWCKEAYDLGKSVWDEEAVIAAEAGLGGKLGARIRRFQRIGKGVEGESVVIDMQEDVFPETEAIKFVLERRARGRWGDTTAAPGVVINSQTINHWDKVFKDEGLPPPSPA